MPGWPSAVYPIALLLAVILPFETIRPVLVTPWLSLTDEKLVLLLAAVAWLLLGTRAVPSSVEWRALLPSLALIGVAALAALSAPDFGDESLRFVWRLAAATFVLLLALRVGRDPDHLHGLLWAITIGAGISAALGLAEALRWPLLDPLFSLFKVAPTRVGSELRVSASFQYATIAAMYFEMAAPLAIVLSAKTRKPQLKLLALMIAVACTANVVLSFTRAGMLTLLLIYAALVIIAVLHSHSRSLLAPTLASAGVLVGGVAILAQSSPVFDLRLVTESDADWYGAVYSAPTRLQLEPAELASVGLDVRNEGRIVWSSSGSHPFALGYRWLTADGTGVLDLPPGEVALAHDVAPGETIHLQTQVGVPNLPPGPYRLDWGMLQRDVLRFYERGWANAETLITVAPPPSGVSVAMPDISPRDDGEAPWVVGRLDLWGAALRLIQTRPVLGVGPDNFRHLYGAQLGLESWDERVQANNLYLEILADVGLVGLAAFIWLIVPPLASTLRSLNMPTNAQRATRNAQPLVLGLGLALSAFLVHGLLDSFLAFTPTSLLFWMILGLLQTQKPHVSGR